MTGTRSGYYQALKQIAKVSNSSAGLRKVFNSVAKSTARALQAAGCRVLLLDPQKKYLITVGAHGLSDLYLKKGPLDAHRSLPEVLEGKTVYIRDATRDTRVQHPEVAESQRVASILGVPILEKGQPAGEIRVYTHEPHEFSEADRTFLLTVANVCALLFEREELQQSLEGSYRQSKTAPQPVQAAQLPTGSLRPAQFAHPSEEEFARLLNFYRIEWLYEPRSFPLRWNGEEIAEMFTPDFYLPELDLYVELTTLKQDLITQKNRKVRRLQELYPNVNIRLLTKNDFVKLLGKYGYGPLGQSKVEGISRVLYSHTQIQRRVAALARRISRDYQGQQVVMVGILKGVICFMADLMRQISVPVNLDLMAISYYGPEERVVKITRDLDINIAGQHVLMVEDIVDTGMTLNYILNYLSARQPASLRVCTLLDKRARRLIDVPLDYVGFEVPDEFVVGYGLDYRGRYRNLPFIGVLHHDATKAAETS
jgi:hypoxanthine phosphoribosyltransferase